MFNWNTIVKGGPEIQFGEGVGGGGGWSFVCSCGQGIPLDSQASASISTCQHQSFFPNVSFFTMIEKIPKLNLKKNKTKQKKECKENSKFCFVQQKDSWYTKSFWFNCAQLYLETAFLNNFWEKPMDVSCHFEYFFKFWANFFTPPANFFPLPPVGEARALQFIYLHTCACVVKLLVFVFCVIQQCFSPDCVCFLFVCFLFVCFLFCLFVVVFFFCLMRRRNCFLWHLL